VLDDVGRLCVARGDARQLFTERRQHEARAREVLPSHSGIVISSAGMRPRGRLQPADQRACCRPACLPFTT
jgi:hypothetical protein